MSDFEKAQQRIKLEMIQSEMDNRVISDIEETHSVKIRMDSILFAHSAESLTFDSILSVLKDRSKGKEPTIYKIKICSRQLFEKVDPTPGQLAEDIYIPITFVMVWYEDWQEF